MTSLQAKHVRYDGSCCLNVRSVRSALDLLSDDARNTRPITRAEVLSFLWFVEMCVTSKGLCFDGTVPEAEVDAAVHRIHSLAGRHALDGLSIEPIRFARAEDVLVNAKAAVRESALLLSQLKIDPSIDRAVEVDEHRTFVRVVQEAAGLGEAERQERALELVTNRSRGSKCLAGLISSGPEMLSLVRAAYEQSPTDGPLVTGALINRFRLNYLNQIASWTHGVYTPDPGFETITREHVRLFKDFLLRHMVDRIESGRERPNVLAENLREVRELPPIGLYALMLTKERGKPSAVLANALEKFKGDSALQKLMWKETGRGIRIREAHLQMDEYHRAVDELFFASYRKLDQEAMGIKAVASGGQTLRKYLVPAALSVVGGLAPTELGTGIMGLLREVLFGTAVGASLTALGDRLLEDGFNSYISQYKSLAWDLGNDPALAQPAAEVAKQVERVFGRPLA